MESTPAQAAEGMAIVRVLAAVLDRLVGANAPLARADPGQVTKFHALKAPGIGILQYLERIYKYASCSTECFILALIYIDRLIQRNNFLLTELNVHRVVITSILLAAKFFDDAYYNNAYYAKVGGVLVSEMNSLEVEFLFRINFSLHVSPDLFHKYHAELLSHAIGTGIEAQAKMHQMRSSTSPRHTPQQVTAGMAVTTSSSGIFHAVNNEQQHLHQHSMATDHTQNSHLTTTQGNRHAQQITPSPPSAHPVAPMAAGYDDMVTSSTASSGSVQPHSLWVSDNGFAPTTSEDSVVVAPLSCQNNFTVLHRQDTRVPTISHSKCFPTNTQLIRCVSGEGGGSYSHLHRRHSLQTPSTSSTSVSTSTVHSPADSHTSETDAYYRHHLQYNGNIGGISYVPTMHQYDACSVASSDYGRRYHSDLSGFNVTSPPPHAGFQSDPTPTPGHVSVVTRHFVGGHVLTGVTGGL